MITPDELKTLIQTGLPGSEVEIQDLTGGGDHFQAIVVSAEFAGQPLVKQHKLVYATVNAQMASEQIHALALKTYTPEKWAALNPAPPVANA